MFCFDLGVVMLWICVLFYLVDLFVTFELFGGFEVVCFGLIGCLRL